MTNSIIHCPGISPLILVIGDAFLSDEPNYIF